MLLYEKIIRPIKDFLRYQLPPMLRIASLLPGYIWARINQLFKIMPRNAKKKILFTLEDRRLWDGEDGNSRYIYLILKRFSAAGYNVYFYKDLSFKDYRKLGKEGRLLFKTEGIKVINKLPSDTSDMIYAFDAVSDHLLKRKWKHLVFVNTFKPPFCQIGELLWIPYFMHARSYETGQDHLLSLRRSNKRKVKMVFAGNTDKKYYNHRDLKNNYGQLTRIEGVNAILGMGDKVKCGNSRELYNEIMNAKGYINECRILLTDAKFPIQNDEWFNLLSSSDFFICLSGTNLPMCHNVIEAMTVGTIPIISYPDWFFHVLEHKKNAIIYSGKDGLIQKIKEVLEMPAEQITCMRKNVIDYYEQYLSAGSFIRKFESQNEPIFTIMLHPRLVCKKDVEDLGRKVYDDLMARFKHHEQRKNVISN